MDHDSTERFALDLISPSNLRPIFKSLKTNNLPHSLQWLNEFSRHDWYFEISPAPAFAILEPAPETRGASVAPPLDAGLGLVAMLRLRGCDFSGPALEIGCSNGLLTAGLLASEAYPEVVITNSSPESLHLVRRKLELHEPSGGSPFSFATLSCEHLEQLPDNTFSLIVLQSVMHHEFDEKNFLTHIARVLKPGGVLVCESICVEGCKVMGLLAQFIPLVMEKGGNLLADDQVEQIRLVIDKMGFYLSRSLPNSENQGPHLFRLSKMTVEGERCGLSAEFLPHRILEDILHQPSDPAKLGNGFQFFKNALRNMNYFDEEFLETLVQSFASYTAFLGKIAHDGTGLPFHGIYLWSKPKSSRGATHLRASLKIATLNTYDLHGGAARAAWRLHAGLLEIGESSQMLVLHRTSEASDVQSVTLAKSEEATISLTDWSRAAFVTIGRHRTPLSETYFTAPVPGYDMSLHPCVRASDIIHLHWVSGMLSPHGIQALQSLNKPIVWTLHDQRAFTGGCHYSAGCVGYRSECDACPQLDSSVSYLPHRVLQEALAMIDPCKVTVVCPSKWLADCARQSAVFQNCRIEVIPYGLETELYVPRGQADARRSLGLPVDGFCFLFGAHSANERRKGTHVLLEAFHIARLDPSFQTALDERKIFFVTYGCDSEKRDYQGIPVYSLGYIGDVEKMATAYAASDIYVCPTLEDNLPNTVLESLSCGRPVIGSNVGGVPDMVKDCINGRLFPVGDSHALAKVIVEVIGIPDVLAAWGIAARKGIEADYKMRRQADRYRQLYNELLDENQPLPKDLASERDEIPLLPKVWDFAEVPAMNMHRLDFTSSHDSSCKILAESSGLSKWPFRSPVSMPMPIKMPSGRPWPRISIVTPSYNQGQYIEQTILSVANQNYPNVEHIVIDGGSTDETIAVIEKYSSLFAYWVSEKDRGQSHAINKGFAKASGEIITWLNSDDLLAPGALAAMALAFDTSGADMVAGICQLHSDGEIFDQHLTSCIDGPLPLNELLDLENHWMSGQFFFQPEVFFKRDLLLRVGGTVDEKAHWSMDYDLWVRFAQAGAILKVIGRPIAQFRLHEQQKTEDVKGFKRELRGIIDRLRPSLQLPPSPPLTKGRKKNLKIVFFNDLGLRTGKGIAFERLARAALLAGHEVIPVSVGAESITDSEKSLPFSAQIVPYLTSLSPDLVLVGNISLAGLGATFAVELAEALPSVLFFHDNWVSNDPLASHVDFTGNFDAYHETMRIPDERSNIGSTQPVSTVSQGKEPIQTTSKLLFLTSSRWRHQQIESVDLTPSIPAGLASKRSWTIRSSVLLKVFLPRHQPSCREELKLPKDSFIILFSFSRKSSKGDEMDHIVQAIRKLNLPDMLAVCMGNNEDHTGLNISGLIHVGEITDFHQQALLYSAADLFVALNPTESAIQGIIEAAACGTPSVAYPVGGIPEILANGVMGRLAKDASPEALAESIMEFYLSRRICLSLGWSARCHAENEFSVEALSRSLFFVLREIILLRGCDLVPKLALQPKPISLPKATVLLEVFGFRVPSCIDTIKPTSEQTDLIMLNYYQSQLAHFRKRSTPWWLKPKAWLAKINRDTFRKKIARNERKQESNRSKLA